MPTPPKQPLRLRRPGGRHRPGRCLEAVDVAVLAGGLGTRLKAVLPDRPKALAPIAGRPFLAHLFDRLAGYGAKRVVLCLGHGAEAVQVYLAEAAPSGLDIVCSVELEPLGTAGALRHARARLRSDPALVLNGDTYVEADFCRFLESHRKARALVSILCMKAKDAGRYGRVALDEAGRFQGFAEKDPGSCGPGIVSAGVYLLSAALLDRIAAGAATSLEREVFASLPAGSVHAVVGDFPFVDIGTPESLAEAQALLAGRTAGRPAP